MNTLEIIQEMRENPALADELRAIILSDELLDLPEEFKKFVIETRERFDTHDKRLDSLENNVAMLKGGYYETKWQKMAVHTWETMDSARYTLPTEMLLQTYSMT